MHANLIIDGNNLLYRAIYKKNTWLKKNNEERSFNSNGIDTSSLQKFLLDLYNTTESFHTPYTQIYVVWDRKLDPTQINWRKKVNPEYKANRDEESEARKIVHSLCVHIKKVLDSMGIQSVFPLASEADDIISYLTKNLEGGSIIFSADQDFYQCVSETCSVYNPQKKILITPENFEECALVKIEHYLRYKAIKGDSSDNLKGLYRYGEKKAKNLVDNWETESKSLTEEQLKTVQDTVNLMDLNYKALSLKEKAVVQKQINKLPERKNDTILTRVMDSYDVSLGARMSWDLFFKKKEELGILKEFM